MLRIEGGKSRKHMRTVRQLHADLILLGYEGSYNRVAAFARDWKAARLREQQTSGRGTFVPLAFVPGEAFQFDWSEDWAIIAGERASVMGTALLQSFHRSGPAGTTRTSVSLSTNLKVSGKRIPRPCSGGAVAAKVPRKLGVGCRGSRSRTTTVAVSRVGPISNVLSRSMAAQTSTTQRGSKPRFSRSPCKFG